MSSGDAWTSPRHRDAFTLFERSLTAVGAVVLVVNVALGGGHMLAGADAAFAVLLACLVLGDLAPVVRRSSMTLAEVSTASVFAFAMLLSHGATAAAAGMALASVAGDLARRKRLASVCSNAAQWTITCTAAGCVFHLATHTAFGSAPPRIGAEDAPAIALAAVASFCSNYLLVGTYLALRSRAGILAFLRDNFWQGAAEDTAALSLGTVIAGAGPHWFTVPLLGLPFVLYAGGRANAEQAERGLYDALTQLPNRVLFADRARQAMVRARRDGVGGSVLLVDLDGFKRVNDTLGHQVGDRLLRQVAARLRSCVRASDTVARLGGDEFAVLLVGAGGARDVDRVMDEIRRALTRPFRIGDASCSVGGSVGAAGFDETESDLSAILDAADQAMYDNKRRRGLARSAR